MKGFILLCRLKEDSVVKTEFADGFEQQFEKTDIVLVHRLSVLAELSGAHVANLGEF